MKRHFFLVSALVALLLSQSMAMMAEISSFSHVVYSTSSGMPSGLVTSLSRQDGELLWAGTANGLVRVASDGMHVFVHADGDDTSLPDNHVVQVLSDDDRLWALTKGGLACYETASDAFRQYDIKPVAACLVQNTVYFGAERTLWAYDATKKSIEQVALITTDKPFSIGQLIKWRGDCLLLVDLKAGLRVFNPADGSVNELPFDLSNNNALFVDSNFRLWRARWDDALECYSGSGQLLARFTTSNSALASTHIVCMDELNGLLIAGTEDSGLIAVNPDSKTIDNSRTGVRSSVIYPVSSVCALCCDNTSGCIWAGAGRGGLVLSRPTMLLAYSNVLSNSQLDAITCFSEDFSNGTVWVGTDGSGICAYNPVTADLKTIPATENKRISSMAHIAADRLLLCDGSRLSVYDKKAGTMTAFHPSSTVEAFVSRGVPMAVADYGNRLSSAVITTSSDALFFDELTGETTTVTLTEGAGEASDVLRPVKLPARAKQAHRTLYNAHHVFLVDELSGTVRILYTTDGEQVIRSAVSDVQSGGVILATSTGLYSLAGGEAKLLPQESTADCRSVVCTDNRRFFVGTDKGVFCYSPAQMSAIEIDESDGAFSNICMPAACIQAANGDVYVGGVNGFLRIDPNLFAGRSADVSIRLASIGYRDKTIDNPTAGVVPSGASSVVAHLLVSEPQIMRPRAYRVRTICSRGHEQIYESETSAVTLLHLHPGTFTLYASCTSKSGGWTEWNEVGTLRIPNGVITTVMFVIFAAALLALLAFVVIRLIRRRKHVDPVPAPVEVEKPVTPAEPVEPKPAEPVFISPTFKTYDETPATVPVHEPRPVTPPSSVITKPVEPETPEPVEKPDTNEEPGEEPTAAPARTLSSASVLIVDDDHDLLEYLHEELVDECGKVYMATNGVEAVDVLVSNDISVVVSDVMMPEMDGYALCRYIKTNVAVSHVPIILLTARSDQASRMLGYKNGADDYMTKPFDVEVLKDCITKLFLRREMTRQQYAVPMEQMPDAVDTTYSSADEAFLSRFHTFVTENISNPDLNTQMLVEHMKMSRTLLYNKVVNLTGLNIKDYVNKVRMEHVIKLLKTTTLPMSEVAEKSGFSSARYFSTAFKTYTGVSPLQYRMGNYGDEAETQS